MARKLTKNQRMIMETVCKGNRDDNGATISWLDMDQLIDRLPYQVTKQALQFSLRFLERGGMLEPKQQIVRRGKRRKLLVPTDLGYSKVHSAGAANIYEDEENDIIEMF